MRTINKIPGDGTLITNGHLKLLRQVQNKKPVRIIYNTNGHIYSDG